MSDSHAFITVSTGLSHKQKIATDSLTSGNCGLKDLKDCTFKPQNKLFMCLMMDGWKRPMDGWMDGWNRHTVKLQGFLMFYVFQTFHTIKHSKPVLTNFAILVKKNSF